MTFDHFKEIVEYLKSQLGWLAGLIAASGGVVVGFTDVLGELWSHRIGLVAAIAGVVCAYCLRPYQLREKGGTAQFRVTDPDSGKYRKTDLSTPTR